MNQPTTASKLFFTLLFRAHGPLYIRDDEEWWKKKLINFVVPWTVQKTINISKTHTHSVVCVVVQHHFHYKSTDVGCEFSVIYRCSDRYWHTKISLKWNTMLVTTHWWPFSAHFSLFSKTPVQIMSFHFSNRIINTKTIIDYLARNAFKEMERRIDKVELFANSKWRKTSFCQSEDNFVSVLNFSNDNFFHSDRRGFS